VPNTWPTCLSCGAQTPSPTPLQQSVWPLDLPHQSSGARAHQLGVVEAERKAPLQPAEHVDAVLGVHQAQQLRVRHALAADAHDERRAVGQVAAGWLVGCGGGRSASAGVDPLVWIGCSSCAAAASGRDAKRLARQPHPRPTAHPSSNKPSTRRLTPCRRRSSSRSLR